MVIRSLCILGREGVGVWLLVWDFEKKRFHSPISGEWKMASDKVEFGEFPV